MFNRQELRALNDCLMGKSNHSHIRSDKLDIEGVIKEFNEKWVMFASIKNKEVR